MRRARLVPLLGLFLTVLVTGCKKSAPPADPSNGPAGPSSKAEYDLAKLTADLKSSSPGRRETAIRMAAELDGQGEEVVAPLLEALKDPTAGESGTYGDRPTSTREAAVLALLRLKDKGNNALTESGLKALEQGLKDSKANVREHTANAIGLVGPDARSSAPALAELCADKDPDVRSAAYRALERVKSVTTAPILNLLTHPDLGIATDAAAALAWLKPTGPEAVPPLLDALKREAKDAEESGDIAYIRNSAAEALAGVGKGAEAAIPTLVELIAKTTVADVERMGRPMRPGQNVSNLTGPVLALRRMGKPAVGPVAPLLKHEQPVVRYQAAAVLGGMGREGQDALPAVQAALEAERGLPTGQLYVLEELAVAILNLGGDPQKVAAVVAELFTLDEEGVRIRAAAMLARVGRVAAPAVPKLVELLNDKSPEVQLAAAEALAAVGPAARVAVSALAKKVEGDDIPLARAATTTLGRLGPTAAAAVPALAKAVTSNDQGLCIEAAQALAAIGPDAAPAVPSLIRQIGDPELRKDERLALLQAVAAIGKLARDAVPAVAKLLGEKDTTVRAAAVETLGKIGEPDAEAIKRLTTALSDPYQSIHVAALKALAGIGATSAAPDVQAFRERTTSTVTKVWASATLVVLGRDEEASLKLVLAAIRDKNPAAKVVRLAAIEAVELIGPKARPAVPDLVAALKDKTPVGRKDGEQVHERAARTLGRLGAREAIPPLTEMLRDSDRAARRAAAGALGMFGPDAVVAAGRLRDLARNDPAVADVAQAALDRIEPPKKTDE